MRVLVTGSRDPQVASDEKIEQAMLLAVGHVDEQHSLIVGDASGVDAKATAIAYKLGWDVTVVRAEWDKYGRSAGPRRNQKMVNMRPDVCVAFPGTGCGTRDCMKRAQQARVPLYVYSRDQEQR